MNELAPEDQLRLQVLLNQNLLALRIDEASMKVFGLNPGGEMALKLNPNHKDAPYLKAVREFISSHILGSPGGYPIYLKRWTRMGQMRSESLAQLLLLGEPEAVVAVVHAQGLTDELARRAWWAMPTAENARRMLEKSDVAQGNMGPILAQYLIDYLPFETEAGDSIDSIRLALQPGLINSQTQRQLWQKAAKKTSYYAGFLLSIPSALPEQAAPHGLWEPLRNHLNMTPSPQKNALIDILLCFCSSAGQQFLKIFLIAVDKPQNQEVVYALLKALVSYVNITPENNTPAHNMETLQHQHQSLWVLQRQKLTTLINALPAIEPLLEASVFLSCISENIVNPIFSHSDASGTVMRRKLEPVFAPIKYHCTKLMGA